MRSRWSRFNSLSRVEQRLLVRLLVLYPVIELALRVRGLRWTQAWLARAVPQRSIADGLTAESINQLVRYAATGPFHASCLRRSLALWWLLQRRGIACEIKIGAHQHAGRFKAHAWVEWEGGGQSDNPAELKHFAVFRNWPEQVA